MMGDNIHSRPVIQVPAWSYDEPEMGYSLPVGGMSPTGVSDYSSSLFSSALQRYLPCNEMAEVEDDDDSGVPVDAYSCDDFRMYEFKVRRCTRARSHDWTECPFAHPGEKARRRDPRRFHYSGTACPDYRKGGCRKGDACEYAHGVFECWLHPARYRTQPCKDGTACRRRVCFFAHTTEQLRVLPPGGRLAGVESYDGSPLRQHSLEAYFSKMLISSPTSTLISPPHSPPSISPPLSPLAPARRPVNDVLTSLRQLQLSKAKSMPSSWVVGRGIGSPRGFPAPSQLRPGSVSMPATPTSAWFETWDRELPVEEPMERVESGRGLRAQMYEKLSKENALDGLHGDWSSALLN